MVEGNFENIIVVFMHKCSEGLHFTDYLIRNNEDFTRLRVMTLRTWNMKLPF